MYDQALSLVSKLKEDETINVGEDWKLVTLFIGGNDLCSACDNIHHYSAEQYVDNIKKAVDYIYNEVSKHSRTLDANNSSVSVKRITNEANNIIF